MDNQKIKLSYSFNVKGLFIYYGVLLFNIALMLIKKINMLTPAFNEFFSHTSNFIITSILMAVISLIWLLQGAQFQLIVYLGLVAIILNFMGETFVHFLNTTDIIDAIYGAAGAVITVAAMWMLKLTGLKETTLKIAS